MDRLDTAVALNHRVHRVLGFFSSCPNWDPSLPITRSAGECVPTPIGSVRGNTIACRRGGGGSQQKFGRGGTLGNEQYLCTVYFVR
jgi:hypothetical protein